MSVIPCVWFGSNHLLAIHSSLPVASGASLLLSDSMRAQGLLRVCLSSRQMGTNYNSDDDSGEEDTATVVSDM